MERYIRKVRAVQYTSEESCAVWRDGMTLVCVRLLKPSAILFHISYFGYYKRLCDNTVVSAIFAPRGLRRICSHLPCSAASVCSVDRNYFGHIDWIPCQRRRSEVLTNASARTFFAQIETRFSYIQLCCNVVFAFNFFKVISINRTLLQESW